MTIQDKISAFLSNDDDNWYEFFHECINSDIKSVISNMGIEYSYIGGFCGERKGNAYYHSYKFTDSDTKEECVVEFIGKCITDYGIKFVKWEFID